jgi:hypothetical protein
MLLLASILRSAYANDCQPNGLGGTFCINDDGSTSSSMPNEAGGQDTISNDGKLTSTYQDGTGMEYTLSGKGVTAKPSPEKSLSDSSGPKPGTSANALLGSHWNTSPDGNSDGAATSQSSIKLDDFTSSKWP